MATDIYKALSLKVAEGKAEPRVWISRLVIYEKIAPEPVVIRDIPLTRGLNIIWAEEPKDNGTATEITGHSAGKTTFCRLVRYVLGERAFGTKASMELIRKALPEGYVAAEVHVAGRKWAVRRPFGSGRMSYVRPDVTIEDLLREQPHAISQDDYPKELGLEDLLDELETGRVVQTDEDIQWAHILAWCTRDQESRFQNIYDWRSPRSESDTPAFRFPKAGPLFVMRAALGLFLPDELKGEEKLARLQRKKERLEREIEEKQREPQFRVNLYEHELRHRLKALLPDEPDIDSLPLESGNLLPDLHRLTERAASDIEQVIARHEMEHAELQRQIDEVGAQIRQNENDLRELDTLFDLTTAAGKELDEGLSARQAQRFQMKEHEDKLCPFGDVLIRECSYVIERQRKLRFTQLQDAHAMEQAGAKCAEEKQKIEKAKAGIRGAIERLQNQRHELQSKRDALGHKIRLQREGLRDLKQTREAVEIWTQRRDQGTGYDELIRLRRECEETTREIGIVEGELTDLLRQHDENRERLAAIFSRSVRAVLSSGAYDGEVALDNRELAFRITHGPAMSGEAVETLSVLLSDVASLVYGTVSEKARLPGFMLHDSPREADLGIRIYRSFIRFVASLQEHFGEADACPFQYVLTTTTAPPDELQVPEFTKLRLNAAHSTGLLLGRNVAESGPESAQSQLFTAGGPA